jgi:hypothetical protein
MVASMAVFNRFLTQVAEGMGAGARPMTLPVCFLVDADGFELQQRWGDRCSMYGCCAHVIVRSATRFANARMRVGKESRRAKSAGPRR